MSFFIVFRDVLIYFYIDRINRRIFCEKFPDRCEEPSEKLCKKFEEYCGETKTLVSNLR